MIKSNLAVSSWNLQSNSVSNGQQSQNRMKIISLVPLGYNTVESRMHDPEGRALVQKIKKSSQEDNTVIKVSKYKL